MSERWLLQYSKARRAARKSPFPMGTGGFLIRQLSLKDDRHCLDPGMRMKANRLHSFRVDVKVVQKYEWLHGLAEVRGADEPCNWTVRRAARTKNYFAPFPFQFPFDESLLHF